MLPFLQTICRRLNSGIEYSLFGLGLAMSLLVALQVFCRYILNHSLFWSEELARYMLVWLTFLGATVAWYRHLHPGIDVLIRRLPPGGQRTAQLLVQLVCMGFFSIMVFAGCRFAWFVRMQISPALNLPKWIVLAIIPVSGLILFLHALTALLLLLRPNHDR